MSSEKSSRSFPLASAPMTARAMQRGRVKFFAEDKEFGYVVPEGKRRREILFRVGQFAGPVERQRGQLSLEPAKKLPNAISFRPPLKDDELIFLMIWTAKGPIAKHWGFAADWEKAHRRICGRLSDDAVTVRVRQAYPDRGILHPSLLWEGELGAFMRKLDHGFGAQFNETAVIEECRATGWMQVEHPAISQPIVHVGGRPMIMDAGGRIV